MRYIVVDSAEFTYPDRFSYATAATAVTLDSPRDTGASFQILLDGLTADHVRENWIPDAIYTDSAVRDEANRLGFPRTGGVTVESDSPFAIEWYSLVPVTMESNERIAEPEKGIPHYPERLAPYRIYDCLRPFDGTLDVGVGDGREQETGIAGLYGVVQIPADAEPGSYTAKIVIRWGGEEVCVPLTLTVYSAVVPEDTLKIVQNFAAGNLTKFHGAENGTPEYAALFTDYMHLHRRMRQNMMYVGGVAVTVLGENQYAFDFSAMENTIRQYQAAGMRYFNGPSIGGRKSWSESTIYVRAGSAGQFPSMSYESYCYLSQYLPALHDMLERNGWLDCFAMGVSDEPTDVNATEFRALCGLVRKFVPDIRLLDALSYCNVHGALDIWVPLNAEYDKHMKEIETLRENGGEIWHYVCCVPREPDYINRFLDYPLMSTRYLFWGNYRHNLTGYLHWATNVYQPGQDPFRINCPEHRNADSVGFLPPGDTHLIYPGEDGPWMSIRGENQRESAEEYEMLRVLAQHDKEKADAVCEKVFRSFRDVEYDISVFRAVRRELLEALSEVQ